MKPVQLAVSHATRLIGSCCMHASRMASCLLYTSPFCELPEIFVENFAVWDDYETDYTIFSVCGIDTVSYTHLDVYKRQVFLCM